MSKKRIEQRLAALEDDEADTGTTIVIRETVVGSEWPGDKMEPGETDTTVTEVEL